MERYNLGTLDSALGDAATDISAEIYALLWHEFEDDEEV